MSAETLQATKAVVQLAVRGATENDVSYRDLLATVYEGVAFHEGVRAFLEKRAPNFPQHRA
jgi:enoyl-CoA hydratase/carnithine racemase